MQYEEKKQSWNKNRPYFSISILEKRYWRSFVFIISPESTRYSLFPLSQLHLAWCNCWLSWHSSCSCNHAGQSLTLTRSSLHLFGLEAPVSPVTVSSWWAEESHVHVSTWGLCWCSYRKSMLWCPAVLSHACPDFLFALSQDTAQVSDSQILRANPFDQYLLKACKLECNCSAAW